MLLRIPVFIGMRCRPVNRVVKLAFLRILARSCLHVKLQYTKMRKRAKSSKISTINRAHKKMNWTSKEMAILHTSQTISPAL